MHDLKLLVPMLEALNSNVGRQYNRDSHHQPKVDIVNFECNILRYWMTRGTKCVMGWAAKYRGGAHTIQFVEPSRYR